MAAANTYVSIATQTLGSAAASVTFSSISGSYTDLVLIYSGTGSVAIDVVMQLNGDTSSLYSSTVVTGNGTSALSSRTSAQSKIWLDSYGYMTTSNPNVGVVHLMNYSNTTTYKTVLCRANNATTGTDATVGLYRSTSAITSLTLLPHITANFSIGCTFSLYGILAA